MKTFALDPTNHLIAHAPRDSARLPRGWVKFSSAQQLAKLAASWPSAQLVQIWNNLSGVTPVHRFTDRKTAIRRLWAKLQKLETPATKADQVIALLKQPSGTSLQSLMGLTGWQAHSVRGFLSGHVSKRLGHRLQSFKREGERIYRIAPEVGGGSVRREKA